MNYFQSKGCSPLISMNPAEFLLDLANGNINDVSVPSELEDKVGNAAVETYNGKPSPAAVHEVTFLFFHYELLQLCSIDTTSIDMCLCRSPTGNQHILN